MPQLILTLPVAVDSANALVLNAAASAAVTIVSATSSRQLLPQLQVAVDASNRLLVRIV